MTLKQSAIRIANGIHVDFSSCLDITPVPSLSGTWCGCLVTFQTLNLPLGGGRNAILGPLFLGIMLPGTVRFLLPLRQNGEKQSQQRLKVTVIEMKTDSSLELEMSFL